MLGVKFLDLPFLYFNLRVLSNSSVVWKDLKCRAIRASSQQNLRASLQSTRHCISYHNTKQNYYLKCRNYYRRIVHVFVLVLI